MLKKEVIVFERNIYDHIDENVKRAARDILRVLDASYEKDEKRQQLRKVVLDSVNELGSSFKKVVDNIGV